MDILKSEKPVLISFGANWCEPCVWVQPILKEVIEYFQGKIMLHKIDIDEHPETAREYHVLSVPTLVLVKQGKEAWRMRGFDTVSNLIKILEPFILS